MGSGEGEEEEWHSTSISPLPIEVGSLTALSKGHRFRDTTCIL